MARRSAVVRALRVLTVGEAAGSSGEADDPLQPTGGVDAGLDAGPSGDAAAPDAALPDAAAVTPDVMTAAAGPGSTPRPAPRCRSRSPTRRSGLRPPHRDAGHHGPTVAIPGFRQGRARRHSGGRGGDSAPERAR